MSYSSQVNILERFSNRQEKSVLKKEDFFLVWTKAPYLLYAR